MLNINKHFCKEAEDAITNKGGRIYLVGGMVRDAIMGNTENKDRDYVITGVPINVLTTILSYYGSVDEVGKSFGVLKFTYQGGVIDIALPRTEKSTGNGHKDFEIVADYNTTIEEDLKRRDFTMNAIAYDIHTNTLIDPFDGQGDIKKKTIKHIKAKAFIEDPLRMLRAIQFCARFKFTIHPLTKHYIRENCYLINSVSGERILIELEKMLTLSEFPSMGIREMRITGLLHHMLPELASTIGVEQPNKYHSVDVFTHCLRAMDSAMSTKFHVRLATLLHDIGKPKAYSCDNGEIHFIGHEVTGAKMAKNILTRLHAPHELITSVCGLIRNHMFEITFETTERAVRRLIGRVGESLIHDLIDLRIGDRLASGKPFLSMGKVARFRDMVDAELAEPLFSFKHLALDGNDLIKMGFQPGKQFRVILTDLLERVMDNKTLNTKETLMNIVEKEYNAGNRA